MNLLLAYSNRLFAHSFSLTTALSMLSHTACVVQFNRTPLFVAATRGFFLCVQFLVKKGAAFKAKNKVNYAYVELYGTIVGWPILHFGRTFYTTQVMLSHNATCARLLIVMAEHSNDNSVFVLISCVLKKPTSYYSVVHNIHHLR